jgi:hypothetical protein
VGRIRAAEDDVASVLFVELVAKFLQRLHSPLRDDGELHYTATSTISS